MPTYGMTTKCVKTRTSNSFSVVSVVADVSITELVEAAAWSGASGPGVTAETGRQRGKQGGGLVPSVPCCESSARAVNVAELNAPNVRVNVRPAKSILSFFM